MDDGGIGHSHAHDDLVDTGELESFTLSEEPSDKPEEGHEHGKPRSIREFFKQEDLAQQYNLHQEANKIDLAALTDQIVFSKETAGLDDNKYRVELSADRLHGAGPPGKLSSSTGDQRRRVAHDRRTGRAAGLAQRTRRPRERRRRDRTPPRCAGG